MFIDVVQILFGCCALVVLLSGLMVLVWLRDRRARWLLWMSALFVFGGFALGLLLAPDVLGPAAIVGGTATFIVAFHLVWSGMRVLEGRRVVWLPVLVAVTFWLVLTTLGPSDSHVAAAAVAQSVTGSVAIGLAAYELWRGRGDGLWSRWALIALFGTVALFFGARLPFIWALPYPFGTQPQLIGWTASFVLVLFCAAVMLAVLCLMLAKERAENELRQSALTDPLTGLLNRRAFTVDVVRIARRSGAAGDSYCVLMMDLDHFKAINDLHGHARGDAMLTHFASVAGNCMRPSDSFYRMGGEEFCAILPATSEFEAVMVAERIRIAFRDSGISAGGRVIGATVSLGVASSVMAGGEPAGMQAMADAALYRAKRLGRDRVAVAVGQHEPDPDVDWAAA